VFHRWRRAGGLSKVCRFAAQPLKYYSVAQHALLVQRLVVEAGYSELAQVALHHNSHEACLDDMPKPLKNKIAAVNNAYDQVSEKFDLAIGEAFSFVWPTKGSPEQRAIKRADNQAFLMEARRLLPDDSEALRQNPKAVPVAAPQAAQIFHPPLFAEITRQVYSRVSLRLANSHTYGGST
jgi:hypothetical protein